MRLHTQNCIIINDFSFDVLVSRETFYFRVLLLQVFVQLALPMALLLFYQNAHLLTAALLCTICVRICSVKNSSRVHSQANRLGRCNTILKFSSREGVPSSYSIALVQLDIRPDFTWSAYFRKKKINNNKIKNPAIIVSVVTFYNLCSILLPLSFGLSCCSLANVLLFSSPVARPAARSTKRQCVSLQILNQY